MTCAQLGGCCDKTFKAESFEEIAEQSKKHGMEMYHKGDSAHIEAMNRMSEMMSAPEAMQDWLEDKRVEFDSLPE